RVVVPGSAFVDLVLRAGDGVGCDRIAELSVEQPLVVPNEGGLRLQVRVHEADGSGRRRVTVSTQPDTGAPAATPWTQHATATVAPADTAEVPSEHLEVWPPARAEAYGPDGWRAGDALYTEVALAPDEQGTEDDGGEAFLLHPSLLEAVARLSGDAPLSGDDDSTTAAGWRDVRLFATGATTLRLRLTPHEDGSAALLATDGSGAPVLTAGHVVLRAVEATDLPALDGRPDDVPPVTTTAPAPVRRRILRDSGTGASPRDELTALRGPEREARLLDLVRTEAADVLGHGSPDEVDAGAAFLELGFDSLTATELRVRLAGLTGLELPAALIFDQPSVVALARDLGSRLDGRSGQDQSARGSLGDLYWQACADGKFADALGLVKMAARLRPGFRAGDSAGHVPAPVRLAEGPTTTTANMTTRILCLPGFSAVSGPHEFGRFAGALRGRREVWALPEPGYLDGQALPEDLDALVRLQADAALRCAGDAPFVVLGRSASGMLAHAVAEQLERDGAHPAGVLLLDSYSPGVVRRRPWLETTLTEAVAARESGYALRNDTRLTAMGRYHEVFADWQPRPVTTRALLVRATEPYAAELDRPEYAEWAAVWDLPHDTVDVPGNHFTILESSSETTAEAVHEWISALPDSAGE
ncbi:thioesterase domain-containing protein, partial [Streptomyces sp. NPDC007851]|uniref:thioesterase domain-containing protein n=1 Tax=Streptomyces sp. NPDC007851 TaxID=3155008 RepID=UPI00340A5C25